MGEEAADDIAAGLSGLPLHVKRLRVASDGFHRRKKHVSWDRVTSVTARGGSVTVEGTSDRGAVRRLLHVKVGAPGARAVESVWIEFCFRRIQRDEGLSGGVNAWGLRRAVWSRILISALVVLLAAYRGYVLFTGDEAAASGPVSVEWGGAALLAYLSAGAAVIALLTKRRAERLRTWWGRWELRREGLFLRDEGGDEKRLALSGRTLVTPAGLRSSDEEVRFSDLTARPVLARLCVAMAERAGARLDALGLHGPAQRLLTAFVLLVPGPALIAAVVWGLRAGAISLIVLALVVLLGGVYRYVSGRIRMKKQLARFLEDGRAMLKRLGWQVGTGQ